MVFQRSVVLASQYSLKFKSLVHMLSETLRPEAKSDVCRCNNAGCTNFVHFAVAGASPSAYTAAACCSALFVSFIN
jgi:hypothetical protein